MTLNSRLKQVEYYSLLLQGENIENFVIVCSTKSGNMFETLCYHLDNVISATLSHIISTTIIARLTQGGRCESKYYKIRCRTKQGKCMLGTIVQIYFVLMKSTWYLINFMHHEVLDGWARNIARKGYSHDFPHICANLHKSCLRL